MMRFTVVTYIGFNDLAPEIIVYIDTMVTFDNYFRTASIARNAENIKHTVQKKYKQLFKAFKLNCVVWGIPVRRHSHTMERLSNYRSVASTVGVPFQGP